MCSLLHNVSVVEHQYQIGSTQRGNPMRGDQASLTRHEPLQVNQDIFRRVRIHGGKRVVQQKDIRVAKDGARNADPLLLSSGQCDAPLAHDGVIAFWESGYIVREPGGIGGCAYFIMAGVHPPECEIRRQGITEQECLLRNITDAGPQCFQRDLRERASADQDLSGTRFQQPGNHVHEG